MENFSLNDVLMYFNCIWLFDL